MHCSDNNRGTTVLQQFANAVREYECVPLRIRTDKGVENMQVGVYMHHARADIDNPVLVGERWGVSELYIRIEINAVQMRVSYKLHKPVMQSTKSTMSESNDFGLI